MQVWLTKDRLTGRITAQVQPFGVEDFPPPPRGRGWETRQGAIIDDDWSALLAGGLPADQETQLLTSAWDAAA